MRSLPLIASPVPATRFSGCATGAPSQADDSYRRQWAAYHLHFGKNSSATEAEEQSTTGLPEKLPLWPQPQSTAALALPCPCPSERGRSSPPQGTWAESAENRERIELVRVYLSFWGNLQIFFLGTPLEGLFKEPVQPICIRNLRI